MTAATYAAAQLLRVLPRVPITRAVGRLAAARIPAPLSRVAVRLFSRAYDVDLGEAVRPDGAFESFDAFFTRNLVDGARAFPRDEQAIVSCADGRLEDLGPIESDGKFQIKGRPYVASELLGDAAEARRYERGQYAIIYLSPRDYHRVHAPVAGSVVEIRSMPGDLFPVNSIGEEHVPSLFSVNRRVAIVIDSPTHGRVTVVMVGAMIVGRITVRAIDAHDVPHGSHPISPPLSVERGEEIGTFHLGSTTVLFFEPQVRGLARARGPIRLGEALHPL
jgi:phosphatidylserine decarboxylase